jgi:hypothetical protein
MAKLTLVSLYLGHSYSELHYIMTFPITNNVRSVHEQTSHNKEPKPPMNNKRARVKRQVKFMDYKNPKEIDEFLFPLELQPISYSSYFLEFTAYSRGPTCLNNCIIIAMK